MLEQNAIASTRNATVFTRRNARTSTDRWRYIHAETRRRYRFRRGVVQLLAKRYGSGRPNEDGEYPSWCGRLGWIEASEATAMLGRPSGNWEYLIPWFSRHVRWEVDWRQDVSPSFQRRADLIYWLAALPCGGDPLHRWSRAPEIVCGERYRIADLRCHVHSRSRAVCDARVRAERCAHRYIIKFRNEIFRNSK